MTLNTIADRRKGSDLALGDVHVAMEEAYLFTLRLDPSFMTAAVPSIEPTSYFLI